MFSPFLPFYTAGSSASVGGLEMVYSGDVFETLQTVMATDDTIRYRVYQVGEICV